MQMANDYDIGKAFAAIEDELIASMIRNMRRHKVEEVKEDKQWSMWQAEQLKSLERYKKANQKKYGKQFKDINSQIDELIRVARSEGAMSQEIAILNAIKQGFPAKRAAAGVTAEFFKLNERKLEALIKATTQDIQKAEIAVLRMANDQYRKIIFNSQVYANSGAGTYEQAVDMATKDMLSAGLNCVEYKNGARHTLADYAYMAVQTASKRAYLQGEGAKRQEWGISTVIMNKRGNPCPKCLPWVGKVMIDDVWSEGSRKDGPYPLMSTAIAAGLYHPRCRDSHTTYFEGINTPPDDKYTRKELVKIEDNAKQEAQQQYAARQEERFRRLAHYSLDPENQSIYQGRSEAWNKQKENDLMEHALKFSDKTAADDYHREKTEAAWKLLTSNEKEALWKYTGSSYRSINKALRLGNIDQQTQRIKDYISDITNALDKCILEDNLWVRRGVTPEGLAGLFDVDIAELKDSLLQKKLINTKCVEKGFLSAGASAEAGFHGINLDICLTKGSKAMYAEPFSQYGGTNDKGTWDGIQKASYIGGEAEVIVQRNSAFKIKEIKTDESGNIINVVLLMIDQSR